MLSRRLASSARPIVQSLRSTAPRASQLVQRRCMSQADIEDPNMNGGYINPPAEKRQFRDPYADWWDKQERRNYGEPVHEDNDILGMFSPEEYKHVTSGTAWFQLGCFVSVVFALCGAVYLTYPDNPSAPRTFPDGLETELGGPGAPRALKEGDIEVGQ